MILNYAQENKDKNFIYEGSDLFCKSEIDLMVGRSLIIKRTSAVTSFIRNFKRGNKDNNTFKQKIDYLKRMKCEFKRFYIQDLPKLNSFINICNQNYKK